MREVAPRAQDLVVGDGDKPTAGVAHRRHRLDPVAGQPGGDAVGDGVGNDRRLRDHVFVAAPGVSEIGTALGLDPDEPRHPIDPAQGKKVA